MTKVLLRNFVIMMDRWPGLKALQRRHLSRKTQTNSHRGYVGLRTKPWDVVNVLATVSVQLNMVGIVLNEISYCAKTQGSNFNQDRTSSTGLR